MAILFVVGLLEIATLYWYRKADRLVATGSKHDGERLVVIIHAPFFLPYIHDSIKYSKLENESWIDVENGGAKKTEEEGVPKLTTAQFLRVSD